MAQQIITPISARAAGTRSFIALTDRKGVVRFLSMPNRDDAVFCAAAIQCQLDRAKRAKRI